MRLAFLLVLLFSISARAQRSIGTELLRLEPSTLPAVCSNGDVRVDTVDDKMKVCISSVWDTLLINGGGAVDPTTTEGDMIYRHASVQTRLPIGTANYSLLSNGTDPTWGLLLDANISSSAAITLSKLAPLAASSLLVSDASGVISASSVTSTEAGYLGTAASNLCGISDTCTMTNKTLTSPTINGASVNGGTFDYLNMFPNTVPPTAGVDPAFYFLGNVPYFQKAGSGTYQLVSGNDFAAKGDILVGTGSGTYANLGVGTDGQGLVADSTQTSGVKWGTVSGAGGTNAQTEYISNGTAESNTTGWATYADAAGAQPVDGTGGTVGTDISFSRLNTSGWVLNGSYSFNIDKTAVNTQGEGVSYDFTIDSSDYSSGKPVSISFNYQTRSAYASGDVYVYVYDVSGSKLLTVLDMNNDGGEVLASSDPTTFVGQFYPVSGDSSYRLIFHIASTNASAWDFTFDSVHAGSMDQVPGAIVSDWQSYTPTTQGLGTISANELEWRRLGSNLQIRGNVTVGTTTAAVAELGLPSGLTIATLSNPIIVGRYERDNSTGSTVKTGVLKASSGASYLTFGYDSQSSAVSPYTDQNGSALFSAEKIGIVVSVPISGWSASAALSTSDAAISTVKVNAYDTTNQVFSASSTYQKTTYDTEGEDNTGSFDASTGIFTAPKSGTYNICATQSYLDSSAIIQGDLKIDIAGEEMASRGVWSSNQLGSLSECFSHKMAKGDTAFVEGECITASGTCELSNALGHSASITINEQPDFSIFGTYGQFQVLTATSSAKTPPASGDYLAMSGNSLPLTPGTWRLGCDALASWPSSSPSYSFGNLAFYDANGADTTSAPTALSSTVVSGNNYDVFDTSPANQFVMKVHDLIVTVTSDHTVYCVPSTKETTPANSHVTVYASAERLQ